MSKYPDYECGECSVWLGGCDLPNDELIQLCRARGCSLLSEETSTNETEGYRKVERGEWIAKPQEWYIGDTEWMCSKCKEEFCPTEMTSAEFLQMMKYCPNCGADMRGEKDEG